MGKIIASNERARSKPCLRCRYSLRFLSDRLHCPECGLPVWISLNGTDALGLSNPDWLRRMAVGCVGLGLSSLGWVLLQVFCIERHFTIGRWWSAGRLRLYVAVVALALAVALVVAALQLLKDEGRAIDRAQGERRYAMIGIIVFAILAVGAGVVFSQIHPLYDWILQISLPLLFAVIGHSTLLLVATRLRRCEARRPMRLAIWVCTVMILDFVIVILWLLAKLLNDEEEGLFIAAIIGPGLAWVPLLIAHTLLALITALAFLLAARRFQLERRDAIRAWASA